MQNYLICNSFKKFFQNSQNYSIYNSFQLDVDSRVSYLMNLWQRMRSMSSACLMEMEILMELMEGSMRTFSFSFLLTTTAVINNSLLDLCGEKIQDIFTLKMKTYRPFKTYLSCSQFSKMHNKSSFFLSITWLPPPAYYVFLRLVNWSSEDTLQLTACVSQHSGRDVEWQTEMNIYINA